MVDPVEQTVGPGETGGQVADVQSVQVHVAPKLGPVSEIDFRVIGVPRDNLVLLDLVGVGVVSMSHDKCRDLARALLAHASPITRPTVMSVAKHGRRKGRPRRRGQR